MTPRSIIILAVISITSLMIPAGAGGEQPEAAPCTPSAYLTSSQVMVASPGMQTITWRVSCPEAVTSAHLQLVQVIDRNAPYENDPNNYQPISTHTVDISSGDAFELPVNQAGTLAAILHLETSNRPDSIRASSAFFATVATPGIAKINHISPS